MSTTTDKPVAKLLAQLAIAGWACQFIGADQPLTFTFSRWSESRTITGSVELDAFTRHVGCAGFDQEGGAGI